MAKALRAMRRATLISARADQRIGFFRTSCWFALRPPADAARCPLLCARSCDEVQGYYFARPLPADEFARFVAEQRCAAQEAPPAIG